VLFTASNINIPMADKFTKIILRTGVEKQRENVIYSSGEPLYVSDYERLFVGDGVTYGGNVISNKFLGFANFNLFTNSSGIVSAYRGDMVFDKTTNNLYTLTGINTLNIESYAKITRNFTADNMTTVLSQTSGISVKLKSLDATYLTDNIVGRGLEKDPIDQSKIRLTDTSTIGGLGFDALGKLKINDRGVTNEMLDDMPGNHIKGNLGIYGSVENIILQDLADVLAPLLVNSNQVFGIPIGTIIDFAGFTPPTGFLSCDGQSFSASEYPELFNVIGNNWGGVAPKFNVPDLRRKTTIGSGGIKTNTLDNYVGAVGGDENSILKKENIPSHTHTLESVVAGGASGNSSLLPNVGNFGLDIKTTDDGSIDGLNSGPLGKPVNIIQPSAVVTKCIKAF
jgi:microcystin-dependent protein